MKKPQKTTALKPRRARRATALITSGILALTLCGGCSSTADEPVNLAVQSGDETTSVTFFSPMEKVSADSENTARTASDLTMAMAEDQLGLTVSYQTYTAENYQDKTYDDVCLERARNNRDDMYLLNTDAIVALGKEGKLADLSQLACAKNLREVVKTANTVDGKLVAIPQEVVAYGLFINEDIFKECGLSMPNAPVGANRWWLETFVFAQAYADLYNGGDIEAEVAALNSGEKKYSDYMRSGFEFLKQLMDAGYIDAENALVSEAFEGKGEGAEFMAGECPIVMAYWGAANTDTAYGNPSFNLEVIGFPSSHGQMPVLSMTGFAVGEESANKEEALAVMGVILSDEALQLYTETNRVISPSKNIKVDCIDALKPLNQKVEDEIYVLASNASMNVEQWGNVCLIVRDLLAGASVDECMAALDALQEEAIATAQ
ncbi:ABC transporter substrate-binding protein [uncultured Adlercreutzia sp.]|uniref:ABC transporter substrate-binding protein n=1 Tax=uncultured Adlercreutzia sp. TaxID=875803 RepID=UPI00261CA841|nr:extracellular solute-binding protein [uncultured Adlercreutzia sp.]